jgi:arylsulfatase
VWNSNSSGQSLYSFIRKTAVCTLLAIAALPAVGCNRESRPRQVLLIVLDAARADRLSSYGYQQLTTPNMDALADRSVVFLNHFVQRTHTRATLPTIFLSRYFTPPLFPESGVLPLSDPADLFRTLDSKAASLPRALSDAGFFTAAISAHVWLKPSTRFAADFDELHDLSSLIDYDRRYSYPRAEQLVDFAMEWVDAHHGQDFFLYLHFMDTHFPHRFDADAREFFGEEEYPADRFWPTGRPKDLNARLSDDDRRYLDALYDGSLRYVDREIGRLVQHLEAGASRADNLIAITSDHGEFLLERPGFFEHGHFWYDLMARVPFILYYPVGLEAQRVSWFSEGVDVFPTLLGLLGIPNPSGATFDGVDLDQMLRRAIDPKEYVIGGGAIRDDRGAIRSERYKAMFSLDNVLPDGRPLPAAEFSGFLFDVLADPFEQVNLWHQKPEVVDGLLREYKNRALPSYRRYRAATTREQPASTCPPFSQERQDPSASHRA